MDIVAWLKGLELDRYGQLFLENDVDASVLPQLTADDLKDMGIILVGHRRKLLDAIAALRNARAEGQPGGGHGRSSATLSPDAVLTPSAANSQ